MIDTVDIRCFLMNQILLGGLPLAIFDFCVVQDQSLLKSEVQHIYIVEYKKERWCMYADRGEAWFLNHSDHAAS